MGTFGTIGVAQEKYRVAGFRTWFAGSDAQNDSATGIGFIRRKIGAAEFSKQ
jgi:hypothetical protein